MDHNTFCQWLKEALAVQGYQNLNVGCSPGEGMRVSTHAIRRDGVKVRVSASREDITDYCINTQSRDLRKVKIYEEGVVQ